MNNFTKRTLTGTAFVAVLLGSIVMGPMSFAILFALILILGMHEFYSLLEKNSAQPQKVLGILCGLILYLIFSLPGFSGVDYDSKLIYLFYPLVFLIFIFELFTSSEKPFSNIAFTLLGIIYIALPFSLLTSIGFHQQSYNSHIILGYFFILWASDTGAYVIGMQFGKHKLFERISPKKSWEGSIGGTVFAVLVSIVIANYCKELSMPQWIVMAIIIVVTGTLGDLVESMFKRSIGVKDSGSILPGHGGILDRFDAVLISVPFVFFYLYFFCSF